MKFDLPFAIFLLALPLAAPAAAPVAVQADARPAPDALEAAITALESFDLDRLLRDRAYAEEMLRHVETFAAIQPGQSEPPDLSGIRMLALAAVGRREEAQAGIDRLVLSAPAEAQPWLDAWWSALILEDAPRAVAVLDGASRRVRGINWAELRRAIAQPVARALFGRLSGEAPANRALRVRFAAALLRIGWPGDADRVAGDDLRKMVLDERLDAGATAEAAQVAATIRTPALTVPLIVLRRYDAVIGERDRLAMLQAALAEEDRETAQALAVPAPGLDQILARVRYLRAVGRNAEAWTLAEPSTREVAATISSGDSGVWLMGQAANALYALGRKEDAFALAGRVAALPLDTSPEMISLYINHIDWLRVAGRHAEALAHARSLEREHPGAASTYGKMWISAGIVCALVELGRPGEATPVLAAMRATTEANFGAMSKALLCAGDTAAAEALMIRRLGGPDADSLAMDFQDLALDPGPPESGLLETRERALRERPAVRAAFDRVARRLRLPLAVLAWD